jgi:hypothetical protein
MRKLLLSALTAGAMTSAVTAALAADDVNSDASPPREPGVAPAATHAMAAVTNVAQHRRRVHAARVRAHHRRAEQRSVAVPGALQSIAACESHDNPQAVGGGGAFRGKYQFDYGTWASVGGHGDPAAAPEAEQDRRAAMLYQREGTTPWPVCGQQ